jgi:hypothetical protein
VVDLLGLDSSTSFGAAPPSTASPVLSSSGGGGGGLDILDSVKPGASSSVVASTGSLRTVLRPTDEGANGLQVDAAFGVQGGQPVLNLSFTNHSAEVASGFMVKLNRNLFGLNPSAAVAISSVGPGATERTVLPLARGDLAADLSSTNQIQVAMKSTIGVAMFYVPFNIMALFSAEGRLEKSNYLQTWRNIQQEHYSDVAPLFSSDVTSVTQRLESFSVFSVAQRNVSGQDFLYVSARVFDDFILMEFAFSGNAAKLCVKANNEALIPSVQAAMAQLLTSSS